MTVSGRSRVVVIAEWSVRRDFGLESRQVILEQIEPRLLTTCSHPEITMERELPGRWKIGRWLALLAGKPAGRSFESSVLKT